MSGQPPERALLDELDAHDALVVSCARGQLTWAEFERAYNNFYPRYPLDGHESDATELLLLEKHADRIALHREIWDQILTKVTSDEHLGQGATAVAAFIGSREAVGRIQALATKYLKT